MTPTIPATAAKRCGKCTRKEFCLTCGMCASCGCGCWMCQKCDSKQPGTAAPCPRCEYCRGCCTRGGECRKAPKAFLDRNLRIGKILSPGSAVPRTTFTHLPRTVGVELEIGVWKTLPAGVGRLNTVIPGITYTPTHDWSVKPSELEMVVDPLVGDAIPRGMLELSRAATAAGVVVNESCAFHVHVGGKDLSYWELRRLLEVYNRVEPEIYSHMIASHRRELPSIHYCQMMSAHHDSETCDRCRRYDQQYPGQRRIPELLSTTLSRMWMARSTEDLKICLLRMLYGIENPSNMRDVVSTRKGGHFEFCRYFGLNLHSWMHRLTVEFRMKEATLDPMELVMWPLWCGWFVHAVTRMTDAEARDPKLTVRNLTERFMPGYLVPYLEVRGL